MIPFNIPATFASDAQQISKCLEGKKLSGDGNFTHKAESLLREHFDANSQVLLTPSCTHALEMCALLLDLKPGDEVIVPAYTFVTSALAFHMHGAKLVFADVNIDTANIEASHISKLINNRTKAIVVVHYAGIACDMDEIVTLAQQYGLMLIEDNAHGLGGFYKGKKLGTFGDCSTLSFHETKNISCGEGGALIINNRSLLERAEVIREKGTNRAAFRKNKVDKYCWIDKGSSYLLSDVLAAMLTSQLSHFDEIQHKRKSIWQYYDQQLSQWSKGVDWLDIAPVSKHADPAWHIYFLKLSNIEVRNKFIEYMVGKGILVTSHYHALNTSPMALQAGLNNKCPNSEHLAETIVRLPVYFDLLISQCEFIINTIKEFDFRR